MGPGSDPTRQRTKAPQRLASRGVFGKFAQKPGLTIGNVGLAAINTGTAVGCAFTNGGWYVIFVLYP
jgi:hypothetical protein